MSRDIDNIKPSSHNRNAVENYDNNSSVISPEMAQRMKRAEFLAQKNKEAIQLNRASVVNDEAEAFHDNSENSSQRYRSRHSE